MASSDEATITSALNRLQDVYFFVTAGVPGWNSSQELSRVAFQLLDYQPALVVALDGANDAALADRYAHRGADWIGVPGEFDLLAEMADRTTPRTLLTGLREALLPALTVRWRMQHEDGGPVTAGEMHRAAARYVIHLARMRDLVVASGGRFAAVFQPMAQLHRRLDVPFEGVRQLEAFHDAAVTAARAVPGGLEYHDFGRLFDGLLPVVHVNEGELTPDTVFVDDVHLHDRGNALVAEALWKVLRP
jgi:lysophospholipase L1-like esterase